MDEQDPRYLLARRLRGLRQDHRLGRKVTQSQLARLLGGVSVPLISSWESQSSPRIPPPPRLDAYAAVFAAPRSLAEDPPRTLSPPDMSDAERQVMTELRIPYTDINDPDYIDLLTYSDLDSVVELHGRIRAANPASLTQLQTAGRLAPDDYTSHLISLGGVDWNPATTSVLDRLLLPVRQVADSDTEGAQYFEAGKNEDSTRYRPVLTKMGNRAILTEDVALFAFAVNPFNKKRTVTVCSGIYSRGTYGAVRALTDVRFRDRNADYLHSRFGNSDAYCILTRVRIINGVTVTPDWTTDEYILFEWSR